MSTFAERFDSYYTQIRHQRLYQQAMNLELSISTVTEESEITEAQVIDSETLEVNEDSGDTEL